MYFIPLLLLLLASMSVTTTRSSFLCFILLAVTATLVLLFPFCAAQTDAGVRPPITLESNERCEPLSSELCSNLGYNTAYIPNDRGHITQEEAITELETFVPLIDSNCSNYLLQFLCAYYLPFCANGTKENEVIHVRPCRSLCDIVRPECSLYLRTNSDFEWPVFLNCSLDSFPDENCIEPLSDFTTTMALTTSSKSLVVNRVSLVLMVALAIGAVVAFEFL